MKIVALVVLLAFTACATIQPPANPLGADAEAYFCEQDEGKVWMPEGFAHRCATALDRDLPECREKLSECRADEVSGVVRIVEVLGGVALGVLGYYGSSRL